MREQDEWDEGHIPGAVARPARQPRVPHRGGRPRPVDAGRHLLRLRRPLGVRRREPARRARLRAADRRSPAASPTGSATATRSCCPRTLSPERRARYSRHLLIPEIGEEGQLKLLDSKILLIGAGGLGSPASLYLAAAGVGHLGIIDADIVDESNLQRQIAHSLNTLGTPKVDSAKRAIEALNPDVEVTTYRERLTSENIDRILDDGWDIIVDGADNFPTRYLVNDASVWRGIPVVHGSIYRFEGQVTVFKPGDGPCYRCLYPSPPPPELAPSCAEGGVLGVLPGIVGTLQTNEALKLALGDRRAADRPAAALRRARDGLHRGARSGGTRTARSAASTRRSPSTSTTSSSARDERDRSVACPVPPVLREEAGGAREVEASGATVRELLEDLAARVPALGDEGLRRRRRSART